MEDGLTLQANQLPLVNNNSSNVRITEELEKAKNEIKTIIEEDSKNIKNLATAENKTFAFNDFSKPEFVIRMAFYRKGDISQDNILFYYAHWTMSSSTLEFLAENAIEISKQLKAQYANYTNKSNDATSKQEKGTAFSNFVRTYQEFNG